MAKRNPVNDKAAELIQRMNEIGRPFRDARTIERSARGLLGLGFDESIEVAAAACEALRDAGVLKARGASLPVQEKSGARTRKGELGLSCPECGSDNIGKKSPAARGCNRS